MKGTEMAEQIVVVDPVGEPDPDNWTNNPGIHQMDIFAFGIAIGYRF